MSTLKSQAIYDTLQLIELEVFASIDNIKSPTKVTTIDSIQRNDMNLHDIGELLASFTPVFVKSYGRGAVSTVSFRGTGASHTKVIWNGFDINSPMLGQTDFSTIPVSLFDEIELRYGGSSLTEVSGALGGSVNLGSRKSYNSGNKFELHQSVGSFNTFMTSANVLLSGKKFGSKTHFSRQSSKNDFSYFNNAVIPHKEMKQENADYRNIGFTQQLDFRINDNQLISFVSWNQWNDRNIPPIMTNVNKGGNHKEWQTDFFTRNTASWSFTKDQTRIEIKGAYFFEDINYNLETSDTLGNTITSIESKNQVSSYSFFGKLEIPISELFQFVAGSKYVNQKVNSNNYDDYKTRIVSSNYLALNGNYGKFRSELLFRLEVADSKLNPIMPMLGVSYKPTDEELYFRVNVSRNFNLPSLNDLYWYPGGNDSLLPEESIEGEVSADYATNITTNHSVVIRATAYYSVVENWIVWQPGDFRYWSPQNVAIVHSNGVELSLKYSGTYKKINFSLLGEYAYTRATQRNGDYEAAQLMYVPKNTFNSFLSIERNGIYINWGIQYTGERTTTLNPDDHYSEPLPAYTINNFTLGKRTYFKKTGVDLRFKVYNIFNTKYQAILWRAMPGRNFEISLNVKI